MNTREVRRQFCDHWRAMVAAYPQLLTDKPAKREAFSCYVDSLHRDGQISDAVAHRVTL